MKSTDESVGRDMADIGIGQFENDIEPNSDEDSGEDSDDDEEGEIADQCATQLNQKLKEMRDSLVNTYFQNVNSILCVLHLTSLVLQAAFVNKPTMSRLVSTCTDICYFFRKPGIAQRISSFCESSGQGIVDCPTFKKGCETRWGTQLKLVQQVMEKREDIAAALERIVNNGINFGRKSLHKRADALGDNLDILRNTEARQQTIALSKVSDGIILLQGRDITIGTVHMWFRRTQTALESAGNSGTEILHDLSDRFRDFYVEGLMASLYLNPCVAVAASSEELDKWRLDFQKQALRVASAYRKELDEDNSVEIHRPAWAYNAESSSEQEEPVEVPLKLGKSRDDYLFNIMSAAEAEACQVGGAFSIRKRVAEEEALRKCTNKRRKKGNKSDQPEVRDKQMVQAFIISYENCVLAECDSLQSELQSDWQKATGLQALQDWWVKHVRQISRISSDHNYQDIEGTDYSEWVLRLCVATTMAHHATNSEVERLFSQCKLLTDKHRNRLANTTLESRLIYRYSLLV